MGQEGALYERGSRLNHSCAPNCTRVTLDRGDAERAFVTLRPVVAGEELTLSYLPSGMEVMGTVVRRRHLWLSRGFLCYCDRCSQPQDEVRQVACPECCAADPQRGKSHARGVSCLGSLVTDSAHHHDNDTLRKQDEARRPLGCQTAFADWWNQSGMWVCRSCGWCSDIDSDRASSLCLHRKEGILSAEIFSLVMANIVSRGTPAAVVAKHCGSKAARNDGGSASGKGQSRQDGRQRQARRDAVQAMLETSMALLGRRHWATFSCVLLRLQQELSSFLGEGWERRPAPSPSLPCPPPPSSRRPQSEFLEWALQELTALWQWLSVSLEEVTSHPPAYYLFDVVCDLLDASGKCDTADPRGLKFFADGVEAWVSAFADEGQRRRFTAVAAVVGRSK